MPTSQITGLVAQVHKFIGKSFQQVEECYFMKHTIVFLGLQSLRKH